MTECLFLPPNKSTLLILNSILVTGAAGFIGFHLAKRLLEEEWCVIGIDNVNDYYDVRLKEARLEMLQQFPQFHFYRTSLENYNEVMKIFAEEKPEYAVNLAAQAGVRYSLDNPHAFTKTNIEGFLNMLEGSRHYGVRHLVFASSSSVYGANRKAISSVSDHVDHPVSLYAATKKANELMAHTYANLFGLPVTGLRFFSVYGPWGRPDMALFLFTKAIIEGRPIDVYNYGKMKRDFTYIDDIIEGVHRLITHIPEGSPKWDPVNPDPATSSAPYRIFNIGNNNPVELNYYIEVIEDCIGKKAIKNYLPMQPGDIAESYADVLPLEKEVGFRPGTRIEEGVRKFIRWFRDYYKM